MPQDLFLLTIRKHLKHIRRLSSKVAPEFAVETIHQFRTEVKKLRALLRLAGILQEDCFSRPPRRFRKIYHAAGDIRDAQTQLQLLVAAEQSAAPGFALWLASRMAAGQQLWEEVYEQRFAGKLKQRIKAYDLPEITPQLLTFFFEDRIHTICAADDGPDDEALHEVRKRLKDLLYVAGWCEKKWPEGWQALSVFPLQQLEGLSDQAGRYNDGRTGLEFLSLYLEGEQDENASAAGSDLEQRWQEGHRQDKERLLAAIRDFCKAASAY